METIKFSHEYPKIWKQTKAVLLTLRIVDAQAVAINKDLIEYDTKFYKENPEVGDYPFEYYPLPKNGKLIQLIFLGNKDIPFCTLRRHTPQKWKYYEESVGKVFDIVITHEG